MAGEFTSDRDAMAAELAWLEGLLADVEDWRALQQLEAREAKGEGITSIDGPRLKASLYAGLSGSRFFKRREAVIAEMARAAKDAAYGPPLAINPVPGSSPEAHDDLRLIRGVSAVLVRRLAALDVRTFNQIAAWSSADVQYVAKILDLGRAISSQNWIEQAALLARARAAPVAAVLVPVPTGRAQTAPAAPAVAPVLATVLEFVPAEPEKLDRPDTAALVPAGPLPAWRYSLDQKSPMNIADALAALSQLHKSVLDDAVAEDRAGVHVATPEPSFNHPGVVALPRPAVPLPASSYRALHPVLPEMALPLPAIDVQPDPVVEPQSRNDEVLPWPAMPPPAVQYALGEVTGPVLPPEEVNLPPPPVPASASGSPIPVPTPVATAPTFAAQAPQSAPDAPLEVVAEAAPAIATTPALAVHTAASWDEDTEREIRALELLLAKPAAANASVPGIAPKARVTIRRAEEAMAAASRQRSQLPDPSAAIVSTAPPAQSDRFDGRRYAAYRERIEEASVDIVRRSAGGGGS